MLAKPSIVVYLLPIAGFAVIAYAFLTNSTFDIHIHDTYYVLSPIYICATIAIYLFANAGIYFFGTGWFRNPKLALLHVLLTLTGLLLIFTIPMWNPPTAVKTYQNFNSANRGWLRPAVVLFLGLAMVLAALFCLLINLLVTIRSRRRCSG